MQLLYKDTLHTTTAILFALANQAQQYDNTLHKIGLLRINTMMANSQSLPTNALLFIYPLLKPRQVYENKRNFSNTTASNSHTSYPLSVGLFLTNRFRAPSSFFVCFSYKTSRTSFVLHSDVFPRKESDKMFRERMTLLVSDESITLNFLMKAGSAVWSINDCKEIIVCLPIIHF